MSAASIAEFIISFDNLFSVPRFELKKSCLGWFIFELIFVDNTQALLFKLSNLGKRGGFGGGGLYDELFLSSLFNIL